MTLETAGIDLVAARVATLETETTIDDHRPDTSPSPFDEWEPLLTYNGIKWLPTYTPPSTCIGCPVRDECLADTLRGDFAWCERVIPADYELTNPKRTAYSNFELKTEH